MKTIIKVMQDKFGDFPHGGGNCMQACVASLLKLPLEAVPHFLLFGEDYYFESLNLFMRSRGFEYKGWIEGLPPKDGNYYITSVESGNEEHNHAVITLNHTIVHDPHPSGINSEDKIMGYHLIVESAEQPASQQPLQATGEQEWKEKFTAFKLSKEGVTHFSQMEEWIEKNVVSPLQQTISSLEQDNVNLKTVMIAAAEEIDAHWEAHCDSQGYGPSSLMNRLEKGIPSQYGYTAGGFKKQQEQIESLELKLKEAKEENERMKSDDAKKIANYNPKKNQQ